MKIRELLERFGGIGLEKQSNTIELLADKDWNVDLHEGIVIFGEELTLPMQLLGSISHASNTWMWSWANDSAQGNVDIGKLAAALYDYGQQRGIEIFTKDTFEADLDYGHVISLIAAGLFDESFYYAGNYGPGTAFFTVDSEEINKNLQEDPDKVLSIFPLLISQFELNHLKAFVHYLELKGFEVAVDGLAVSAVHPALCIKAEFDDHSRLVCLNGESISPESL